MKKGDLPTAPNSPSSEAAAKTADKHAARVDEYIDSALRNSDPLLANLEVLNGVYFHNAFQTAQSIQQRLVNPPPDGHDPELDRDHDRLLRYGKQASSTSNLILRITRERAKARDSLDPLQRVKYEAMGEWIPNPDGGEAGQADKPPQ